MTEGEIAAAVREQFTVFDRSTQESRFDPRFYEEYLRRQQISAEQFEKTIGDSLRITKLADLIGNGVNTALIRENVYSLPQEVIEMRPPRLRGT